MPKIGEWFGGKKGKFKTKSTVNPMQEDLLAMISDALESGQGPLAGLFGAFNEEEFNKGVRDPALKNFEETILPMLQEKFIGNGQLGGSGQRDAFGKAGSDLQSKLAELLYGAQQQQKQNQVSGVQNVLGTKTFENIYKPPTSGAAAPLLGSAIDAVASAYTGGASSAAKGATELGKQATTT